MCEQVQNRGNENSEGAAEFKMPDCCGPMMDRMMGVDGEEEVSNGQSFCEDMMNKMFKGEDPMASCPMSEIFRKSTGMRGFGLLAMLPGLLLVLGGVAIILEPQILIWLMAAASILVGFALLGAAAFFRRVTAGIRTSGG